MVKKLTGLQSLKKQLKFNGSDEAFLELVNKSLEKIAPIYRQVFEMFYGINCEPVNSKTISETIGLPSGNICLIRKLVLDLCKKDFSNISNKRAKTKT